MKNSIFAFSATETGYNHLKINKVCEDASDFYDDEKIHIGVIADGHGSDNYPRTDRGARFAVDAAIRCIVEFIENADPQQVIEDERHDYALLTQLAKSILKDWYQAVESDYNKYPFEEAELEKVSEKYRKRYLSTKESERRAEKAYGCTLIAYTVTESYSFGLQIGDGKCVVINQRGDFTEPIPWDNDCQMNVTTSICDSDAIDEFRFCLFAGAPAAVFCGSDGIDDSYANPEEMYALYRSILKIFVEHGIEVGQNEIKEYLPVLTKRGSGDDVSVATVIDMHKITELAPIFEIQSSLFNLTTEFETKKKKLTVTGEKMDSLYKKIRDFSKRDSRQQDIRMEINDLFSLSDQLREEIEKDKEKIEEFQHQYQNLIYDIESASFDKPAGEGVTEAIDGVTGNKKAEKSLIRDGATAEIINQKGMPQTAAKADADVVDSKPIEMVHESTVEGQSLTENSAIGPRPESSNEGVVDQSTVKLETLENTAVILSQSDDSTEIIEGVGEEV